MTGKIPCWQGIFFEAAPWVIVRGRRQRSILGSSPGAYVTKTESAALACQAKISFARRNECFACEVENFACETFSFRMPSAKPLKTFWFSRPRNFRYRGFQCYQSLAGRFCFALFLGHVFRSWAEVGHGVFFTEQFTLPWIQLFGKQNSDQAELKRDSDRSNAALVRSLFAFNSRPMVQANPS